MPTVHSSRAVARGAPGRRRSALAAVTGVLVVTTAGLLAAGCGPPPEVDSENDPRGLPDTSPTGTAAPSGGPSAPTGPGATPPSGPGSGPRPSGSASPPPGSAPTDPGGPGSPDDPSLPGDEPGFPEEIALACDDHLPADDVLALLQRQDVLPDDHDAEVTDGPYCSGQWHYSQVAVPGRDPLQAVSRGDPEQLTLVTAGTDVCTVEVRLRAPAGIRRTAACLD